MNPNAETSRGTALILISATLLGPPIPMFLARAASASFSQSAKRSCPLHSHGLLSILRTSVLRQPHVVESNVQLTQHACPEPADLASAVLTAYRMA
ncbi:hypothetical protein LX36DRAFT_651831 [Colletotrichum falcatum]|nr:hypothetical protein LX36DRAFT_651831 [Colletotrichum falcatum]